MKFTIKKKEIVEVLGKLQGITGKKTNLAITENLLITAKNESEVSIIATDLETGFQGFYPAEVYDTGKIAINSKKLYEILKDFPDDEILINEVENRYIEILSHDVQYHLLIMDSDNFPEFPDIDDTDFLEIDSVYFKKMITSTVYIQPPTEGKGAHLTGVYLEISKSKKQPGIRLVATDIKRLSKIDLLLEKETRIPFDKNMLIPKKSLNEISKFLEDEATVKIGRNRNNFIIKKEKEIFIICLLEGDFPDYHDIFKSIDRKNFFVINRHQLFSTIKRMSILSSEKFKSLLFNFSKGLMIVSNKNPEMGESTEKIPLDYDGKDIEVLFNPKYIMDSLNIIETPNVKIFIKHQKSPCLIEEENDEAFSSLIMPIKMQEDDNVQKQQEQEVQE
ncbi:MAG: DNA polymerase III subunit beta [Desulfobacterales bacterium]|nr:DNA polymerase III subunit beta [Desulfobacterales bacterium]